ncbi:MAG TPA: hypothetical protein VGO57_19105 [Verrucomicrobiae bacterium]|jgi:hypothetical protein
METPTTPFDLNQAIQRWRNVLAQSPAIRGENLDELEVHLRDSVATLQARDLSVEEAFLVATKRVGSNMVLGKEYGKMNPMNIWTERCLWALIAMQIWEVIQNGFISITCLLRSDYIFVSGSPHLGWDTIRVIMVGMLMPILLTAFIFWRLLKSPASWMGRFLENISIYPATLAALLFVLNAGGHLFGMYCFNYAYHNSDVGWLLYVRFLPGSLCCAGLIFFLARKRVLRKA